MPLSSGTRLGVFEILAPLGAGGMGEVYRARDTRLDRDVAIKVLPERFATDPDRLARFEREARALAALNHPNIAHLHGLEESGGVRALVMEIVPGEDLAARIARGPMPVDDALGVARQIADALDAAHERGFIHRDLKPGNIKITPDGVVKVLDFGLAKAADVALDPGNDLTNSPTFASPATNFGVILGTAAYMAPEQAKGKAVDKRADIWAFGCVLYEMLTGRATFAADSVAETLTQILTREPDWAALPPAVPPEIHVLLRRSLAKDVRERLRDIGDARFMLAEHAVGGSQALPSADQSPRTSRSGRARAVVAAAGLALAAAAAGYLAGHRGPAGASRPVATFRQITDMPGAERQPAIAPDGRSIVFVSYQRGNADLYLLRVGGRNAVPLTADSAADDYAPAYSHDGNRIAFRSERDGGGIYVMEATGESVRRVSEAGFDPSWSPDGRELVVSDEHVFDPMSRAVVSRLWVIDVASGARRQVAEADAVGPRFSPDGRRIAFWGIGGAAVRDIFTVASDGSEAGEPRRVTDDDAVDWNPTWSPDGRFLYFASNRGGTMNLWRVPIDQSSGGAQGPPEPVTAPTAWTGGLGFSSDGRSLVFADQDQRSTIWAVGFDPQRGAAAGSPRVVLQGRGIVSIDLDPEGRRVVFSQRGHVWESLGVINADGTGWSRLTDDAASYFRLPSWSPDGERLLFYTNRRTPLWSLRADGSGMTALAGDESLRRLVYPAWLPDGRRIIATTPQALLLFDISKGRLDELARASQNEADQFLPLSWSPDGRWLAGTSQSRSRRPDVAVVDAGLGPVRILVEDGSSPRWLPDSQRLIFSAPDEIAMVESATGRRTVVLRASRGPLAWGRSVSLSRDGRTLVYLETEDEGDLWLMTLEEER